MIKYCAVLLSALVSCGVEAAPPRVFEVVSTSTGEDRAIPLEDDVVVCAMATWCPYSRQFRDFVGDARIQRLVGSRRFVFVFDDEWETIAGFLREEDPRMTESELADQVDSLKAASGWARVLEPEFFSECREAYYSKADLAAESFPTVLGRAGFRTHPLEWFVDEYVPDSISGDALLAVWESHSPN